MRIFAALVLVGVLLSTAVAARAQEGEQGAPPPGFGIYERGRNALNTGNFDQAVVDFSLFILLNPTDGRAYYARAVSYQERGDLDQALGDLTQALRYTDSLPELHAAVYSQRGNLYASSGRSEEALADFDEALNLSPTPQNYLMRAILYLEEADYQAAVDDLDEAINLTPGAEPELYFYRATAKSALANDDEAASDYLQWVNGIQERTAEADPLEAGQTITLNFEPSLVFSIPFEVEEGQTVNVVAANLSGDADPLMVITDEAGNPLVGNDTTRAGDTSAVIRGYQVEEGGSYNLLVTHSISGYNGRVVVLLEMQD